MRRVAEEHRQALTRALSDSSARLEAEAAARLAALEAQALTEAAEQRADFEAHLEELRVAEAFRLGELARQHAQDLEVLQHEVADQSHAAQAALDAAAIAQQAGHDALGDTLFARAAALKTRAHEVDSRGGGPPHRDTRTDHSAGSSTPGDFSAAVEFEEVRGLRVALEASQAALQHLKAASEETLRDLQRAHEETLAGLRDRVEEEMAGVVAEALAAHESDTHRLREESAAATAAVASTYEARVEDLRRQAAASEAFFAAEEVAHSLRVAELATQLEAANGAVDRLRGQLAAMSAERDHALVAANEARAEASQLASELRALQSEHEQVLLALEDEQAAHGDAVADLTTRLESEHALQDARDSASIAARQKLQDSHDAAVAALKRRLAELEAAAQGAVALNEELRNQLRDSRGSEEVARLESELAAQEARDEAALAARQKLEDAHEAAVAALTGQVAELEAAARTSEARNDKFQRQLHDSRGLVEAARADCARLQARIAELEVSAAQSGADALSRERDLAIADHASSAIDALRLEHADQIYSLEAERDEFAARVGELEAAVASAEAARASLYDAASDSAHLRAALAASDAARLEAQAAVEAVRSAHELEMTRLRGGNAGKQAADLAAALHLASAHEARAAAKAAELRAAAEAQIAALDRSHADELERLTREHEDEVFALRSERDALLLARAAESDARGQSLVDRSSALQAQVQSRAAASAAQAAFRR